LLDNFHNALNNQWMSSEVQVIVSTKIQGWMTVNGHRSAGIVTAIVNPKKASASTIVDILELTNPVLNPF
jgi:hypothetical protein